MSTAAKRPTMIVDCDPGHDDVFALVVANHYANLIGITAVHGNAPLSRTLPNALISCDVFGISAPVFAGADRPLVAPPRNAPHIHGESGLGGPELPPVRRTAEKTGAVEAIIELVRKHEGEGVWLAPLGPLTNIALALRAAPDLGKRIAGISLMGGGTLHGNRAPHAEFNIWADPEAAAEVLASGCDVVMFGLDATHQVRATEARIAALEAVGTPMAETAAAMMRFSQRVERRIVGWDAPPVHDPCPVAWLLKPDLFALKPCRIAVETGSDLTRGHTAVEFREAVAGTLPHRWATTADADGIFALVAHAVGPARTI